MNIIKELLVVSFILSNVALKYFIFIAKLLNFPYRTRRYSIIQHGNA